MVRVLFCNKIPITICEMMHLQNIVMHLAELSVSSVLDVVSAIRNDNCNEQSQIKI